MAGRVHSIPKGTFVPDGLCTLTDREYAAKVDTSPTIRAAYATLGRIANPSARMLDQARTFGRGNAPRNISGAPKGEPPACGTVSKGWRDVGIIKPRKAA